MWIIPRYSSCTITAACTKLYYDDGTQHTAAAVDHTQRGSWPVLQYSSCSSTSRGTGPHDKSTDHIGNTAVRPHLGTTSSTIVGCYEYSFIHDVYGRTAPQRTCLHVYYFKFSTRVRSVLFSVLRLTLQQYLANSKYDTTSSSRSNSRSTAINSIVQIRVLYT